MSKAIEWVKVTILGCVLGGGVAWVLGTVLHVLTGR